MNRKALFLTALLLCSSCWGGFVINDKLVGNFYFGAADVDQQLALIYDPPKGNQGYEVVSSTVFAAGYDDKFIIVKQHPYDLAINREYNDSIKRVTRYYLVIRSEPFKMGTDHPNSLIGPMTESQFEVKRKQLNVPATLRFTVVYKQVE